MKMLHCHLTITASFLKLMFSINLFSEEPLIYKNICFDVHSKNFISEVKMTAFIILIEL